HRPSEFRLEYIDRAKKYIDSCQDIPVGIDKIKVNIPSIEGFAMDLGVARKTLYNWGEKNPEFLHTLKEIKNEQRERLINNGLSGDYNSTIAKLILSSNHGMRERSDLTSDNKSMAPVKEVAVTFKDFSEKKIKNKKNGKGNKNNPEQNIQTPIHEKA
ncbi:MAG: terminase small subunit, partial [Candidatus Heimdallarchaeaceae archaeon]